MIFRKLIAALTLTATIAVCHGQKRIEMSLTQMIDSLKSELGTSNTDTLNAYLLMRIGENYMNIYPDSSMYYLEQSIALSKKINYSRNIIVDYGFLAGVYKNQGNLPKALELCLLAIELAGDKPSVQGAGPAQHRLGQIYHDLGEHDKSMAVYDYILRTGGIVGKAYAYMEVARIQLEEQEIDSALANTINSIRLFKAIKTTDWDRNHIVDPEVYNVKAKIHMARDERALALETFMTSLKLTEDNGESVYTSRTYNDLAEFYKLYEQPDSTIIYAEKALEEARGISFPQEILRSSLLLATAYQSSNPGLALKYHRIAWDAQNNLYGSGNIQVMKDMINARERAKEQAKVAKDAYRNSLQLYLSIAGLFFILVIAVILYRENVKSKKTNTLLSNTLDNLRSTQTQLIQSEKMASLGELTAGIAHEIQNPLNFVNNFSEVNDDLIEEAKKELAVGSIHSAVEIINDVQSNSAKINHHGKRADGIVKSMLQHSQKSSGQKELTDINALCDEYLRLAYHGMRAKDKSFNAEFKTELDPSLPKINVVPQDIGRVLLNLINNAFQATSDVNRPMSDEVSYQPLVIVSTKKLGDKIEISVKDNGPGIPENIKDKIFQPFFTTKPTGQGTGLGLSLAYDIVTKGHGGTIELISSQSGGAEFVIKLSTS